MCVCVYIGLKRQCRWYLRLTRSSKRKLELEETFLSRNFSYFYHHYYWRIITAEIRGKVLCLHWPVVSVQSFALLSWPNTDSGGLTLYPANVFLWASLKEACPAVCLSVCLPVDTLLEVNQTRKINASDNFSFNYTLKSLPLSLILDFVEFGSLKRNDEKIGSICHHVNKLRVYINLRHQILQPKLLICWI